MENSALYFVVLFLLTLCARTLSTENRTGIDGVITAAVITAAVPSASSSSLAEPSTVTTTPTRVSSSTTSQPPAGNLSTTAQPPPSTTPTSSATPILPEKSRWNVTDAAGHICILLETGIRITFNYKNATSNVTGAVADVPVDAVADGVCGAAVQSLQLRFYDDWQLTLNFTRNNSASDYYMSAISLTYTFQPSIPPFPQTKDYYHNTTARPLDADSFLTPIGTSYICTSQQTMYEDDSSPVVGLTRINLYDSRVEAFRGNKTSSEFSTPGGRCVDDELSLLVPIIVGACLAGLIVIVLVAYFIGRRHSKRGYENV